MNMNTQVVGGPLDGQTVSLDEKTTEFREGPQRFEYRRHQLSKFDSPQGEMFIFAPSSWTDQDVKSALPKAYPSRNQQIQDAEPPTS
ncbi:hypothetical protein D9M68_924210 [compost metagenome]